MKHGKFPYSLGLVLVLVLCQSCGPERRLATILRKYPHLIQTRTKDSTVVRFYRSVDTAFMFTQKTDTVHTEHFTFWRSDSTIRIRGGCPPCSTQIIQPEKIIQTSRQVPVSENKFTMREWLMGFAGPFMMLVALYLLNARSKRSPGY